MAHRRRPGDVQGRARAASQDARRKEIRRLTLGIAVILVAFIALFYFGVGILAGPPAGPRVGVRLGDAAPDFTLTDVDGGVFRLSAQRGRPVLLDFMGSRCPTCVQEMPFLVSIRDRYASRGLVMISIDVGGQLGTEDPEVARTFLATYGGTWPIALDNSNLGLTFQVSALPTIYLIDAQGYVAFRHAGVITDADLAPQVERLL